MKRIAIITGASSGMGAEFARQLGEEPCADELWLLARCVDRLKELEASQNAARKENPSLPLARAFQIDLSGRSGVSAFKALLDAEKLIDKEQGFEIRILVNNAGFGTYGPFLETPLETQLDMVELNCVSLTGIAGLALPFMNKGSVLINTASLAAFLPLGNFSVYAATKAYVLSFSESLAAEVADRGIKVCALCPGSVSTEFAQVASNGARKEVLGGKSVQKTVAHCIKAARRGRKTALWALKWKVTAFMSRFIGRYFGARWTYIHCPRPRKD
ncbi:MAG: SDR family NAD(P)-dependent oxidoreductase [Treponema sp.]|nr:SDR family NAD(P)-dependent oxidoreductase [Treponema sp.]